MESAFEGTSAAYVFLEDQVKTIQSHAFDNCDSLTYIYIPASVTTIGEHVFPDDSNVVIGCKANSAAHEYAIENDIAFYIIL